MTINTSPMSQAAMRTTFETVDGQSRHAQFNTLVAYLDTHLAPEDIVFENFRGIHGEPAFAPWCANAFVKYLYKNPATPSEPATPPVYYSEKVAQAEASAVASMQVMLAQPFVDQKTKAVLQQSIQRLQANTQASHCREQLAKVLENAKAAILHRGLADEPQCAETSEIIDAVLDNMNTIQHPDTSAQAAQFFVVYSKAVKQQCEYVVANGRNPFPLSNNFFKICNKERVSHDVAWEKALEAIRPQTRLMAEELKNMLRPYAGLSPAATPAAADSPQTTAAASRERADSWQMV
ncbi:hypothetical protein CAL26_06045 [Bordetella genomosp. 9]|uniref:Uncharacterized protein n=1 Tax=Bordetella genomosp. 9 TaxID=1416803 RepID=A0A261REF4_9BORD|nr:hypothetical protein [Bordetella genomosp. 9]OZI23042.1 hypothetical protein CAL26_06045 [Bordetella genomosp. 9]